MLTTVGEPSAILPENGSQASPPSPPKQSFTGSRLVSDRRNTERCEDSDFIYFPLWAAIKMHEGDNSLLAGSEAKGKREREGARSGVKDSLLVHSRCGVRQAEHGRSCSATGGSITCRKYF